MTLSGRGRQYLFVASVVMQGLIVIGLALLVLAVGSAAPSTIAIGLGVCFIPYALALGLAGQLTRERASRVALGALLILGLAFVVTPPVLSDDVYRFLWEGRLWLEGLNPYHLAPADPALEHLRDDVWAQINNKSLASIYPPLSQVLFALIALLGGGIWTAKLLALLAHAVTTIVVSRISPDPRAPLALGLNPLLLSEGALHGHFDLLTGLALLVAAWGLARHRVVRAAIAICVAVGLKAVGVVMAPLFLRRPIALSAVVVVSTLVLFPLAAFRPIADAASGPVQFAARWRGNESIYAFIEWMSRQVLEESAAIAVARATVVGVVLAVGTISVAKHIAPLRAARIILWTTLLLSPQVHPWYLAWLLPIEIVSGGLAGLVWSATVLCAYAPLDRWLAEGVWEMPIALQIFEYSAVALALIIEGRRWRGEKRWPNTKIDP